MSLTKVTYSMIDGSYVNVNDFGAVGDGTTDDTAAIQAAIDYAVYQAPIKIGRVYIPSGSYRISDTIHIGYGTTFTGVRVFGDGIKENGEAKFGGTSIIATFNDRPAFAIQGARYSTVEDMTILGVNLQFVASNALGRTDCTVNDSLPSAWLGPDLGPTSASQYAVYAGVAIDPYSGPKPATSYPAVNYPGFLGPVTQYNKSFSSAPRLLRVQIRGFVAAVAVQPCDADGNGDFLKLDDCEFAYNVYGVVVGNSQSRTVGVYGCDFNALHTAFDTRTFGRQSGYLLGNIDSCSFNSTLKLCNLRMGFGSITFTSCYSENCWTFGSFVLADTNGVANFHGCDWNMYYVRFPTANYVAPRGTPLNHFPDGNGPVSFVGGLIKTDFGLILNGNMRISLTDVSQDASFLRPDVSSLPNLIACPATVRTRFVGNTSYLIEKPDSNIYRTGYRSIANWNPATNSWKMENLRLNDLILQGREKTISRYVSTYFNYADFNRPALSIGAVTPRYLLDKSTSPVTLVDTTITFTDPYVAGTSTDAYPIGAGDMLWDSASGLVFLVYSAVAGACTAIALNGYRWNTATSKYELTTSFSASSGVMELTYTGQWVNNGYLFGDFTSGSATITNVGNHDNVWSSVQPVVGDFFVWTSSKRCPFTARVARITNVDGTARTITLNRTATYSVSGEPLMTFYTP